MFFWLVGCLLVCLFGCLFVWVGGLGWVGLGWVGLGWVGLGCCWVGLGWVGLGWVVVVVVVVVVGLCRCLWSSFVVVVVEAEVDVKHSGKRDISLFIVQSA